MSDRLTIQEQRRRDTYALLRSLLDCYPGPKTWTGSMVARSAKRGAVASVFVKCKTCDGYGIFKRGQHRVNCGHCGGSSLKGTERSGRGFILVDGYTGEQPEKILEQAIRYVRCDSCGGSGVWKYRLDELTGEVVNRCQRCDGSGKRQVWLLPIPTDPEEAEFWLSRSEDKQGRLDERGSYRELRSALEYLYREHPARARGVWRYVVCDPESTFWTLRSYTRAWLDECVDMLALRLPPKIRVPIEYTRQPVANGKGRWANGHAQGSRNDEIRAAFGVVSATKVAASYGITRRQVQRIWAVASQP